MNPALVVLGAAVGAPLPYLTDRAVQRRHDPLFPWGTFTVNVIGSFILGAVVGAARAGAASPQVQLGLAVGFCGALTSYSTLSYETLRLTEGNCVSLLDEQQAHLLPSIESVLKPSVPVLR